MLKLSLKEGEYVNIGDNIRVKKAIAELTIILLRSNYRLKRLSAEKLRWIMAKTRVL